MRLFLLTSLVMVAFAANSVLNRMALSDGDIGPMTFAVIRLGSGALALAALVLWRSGSVPVTAGGRLVQTLALSVYVLGFSFAYLELDAGAGALLLFGGVQITMFAGACLGGERLPARRWVGGALALAGLTVLLWPAQPLGMAGTSVAAALSMLAAAVGWGVYSLAGRRQSDPLSGTAANFVLATPLALVLLLIWPETAPVTARGVLLAVVSGVVTSGLGYAVWYAILPRLTASGAGLAQLTVPLIAAAGGFMLLAEVPDMRFWLSGLMVLGGIALALGLLRIAQR